MKLSVDTTRIFTIDFSEQEVEWLMNVMQNPFTDTEDQMDRIKREELFLLIRNWKKEG